MTSKFPFQNLHKRSTASPCPVLYILSSSADVFYFTFNNLFFCCNCNNDRGINDHILSTIVNNVHLLTSTHHNPFQTYSTIHLHNMTMMMMMRGVWLLYNCHVFKSKQIIIMQRQRWVQNGRLWWGVGWNGVWGVQFETAVVFWSVRCRKWAVDRVQFFVSILSAFKILFFFLCRN